MKQYQITFDADVSSEDRRSVYGMIRRMGWIPHPVPQEHYSDTGFFAYPDGKSEVAEITVADWRGDFPFKALAQQLPEGSHLAVFG